MLIDPRSKFITISYIYSIWDNLTEEEAVEKGMSEEDLLKKSIYTWTFYDSARLFPSSLNEGVKCMK